MLKWLIRVDDSLACASRQATPLVDLDHSVPKPSVFSEPPDSNDAPYQF